MLDLKPAIWLLGSLFIFFLILIYLKESLYIFDQMESRSIYSSQKQRQRPMILMRQLSIKPFSSCQRKAFLEGICFPVQNPKTSAKRFLLIFIQDFSYIKRNQGAWSGKINCVYFYRNKSIKIKLKNNCHFAFLRSNMNSNHVVNHAEGKQFSQVFSRLFQIVERSAKSPSCTHHR